MTKRLISLACYRCGAPLEIPDDLRFVTCSHCGTSLTVEREGDAFFTRELKELAETTRDINEKVDELHAAVMADRREQDWADEQAQALLGSPQGLFHSIGMIQKVMAVVMSVPIAAFFLFVGWQFHPIVGLVMACIPLMGALSFVLISHQITSRLGATALERRSSERPHGD